MPHGGKRAGSGQKPGTKQRRTVAKEAAREVARVIVMRELEPLIRAQIANALGVKYFVVCNKKTKTFVRVARARAKEVLRDDEEIIEVWEKDPSLPAFTALMNRALDKPANPPQSPEPAGVVIRWQP